MKGTLADADFNVGFGETMKIAATGHEQAELLSETQIFSSLPCSMSAVVDFHAIESVRFQLANQLGKRSICTPHPSRMG